MSRRPSSPDKKNFASSALFSLALQSFRLQDKHLVSDCSDQPDFYNKALIDEQHKHNLLDRVYRRSGALPLLSVGQLIPSQANHPIISALLNSAHSDILAAKWQRMEAYYHSSHRTRIHTAKPSGQTDYWQCIRHIPADKDATPENLLICGVMLGLLQTYTRQTVCCSIAGHTLSSDQLQPDQVAASIRQQQVLYLPADQSLSWTLSWSENSVQDSDNTTGTNAEKPDSISRENIAGQLARLIATDICHHWSIAEAAGYLSLSSRTLQRRLQEQSSSFSSIVRQVRIQYAGHLLQSQQVSIAETGFCCGFSDQAHFQRVFKQVMNMTPDHFRLLSSTDPNVHPPRQTASNL